MDEEKGTLLKFMTCGSVDDGKSTLIGHMLYDAKLLFTDQKRSLIAESKTGSCDGNIDYSLLLDGLMAEQEQGITIDVAYRYFSTPRRSFIVADCPGHEEYTRNMAVGASFADLAVILLDVTKGVLTQTARHTRICALMGIRDFVFVINKMDLTDFDETAFLKAEKAVRALAAEFSPVSVEVIPTSATEGDNVTEHSGRMPWYRGEALLPYLENFKAQTSGIAAGFFMPIQRVSRPNANFRGFQGQPACGSLRPGDEVRILPGKEKAHVNSLYSGDRKVDDICAGQPACVCLDREVDVSRGDVIVKDMPLCVGTLFSANVLWMDDSVLAAGRNYILKLGTKTISATVLKIRYRISADDGAHIPADTLSKNDLAVCDIATADRIVFDRFWQDNTQACDTSLGTFLLIDRITDMTSACGTVLAPLEEGRDIYHQEFSVDQAFRASQKGQKPLTVWFTGLSGAGKSTLANALELKLAAQGRHTMILDGDNVRLGLNRDLGFSESDRVENIRRIAEVARLMNEAGLIVLVCLISPFERDRKQAREIIGSPFVEVYVDTPLEECERRDTKDLYKRARKGEIPNFTGISAPYEEPASAELTVHAGSMSVDSCVEQILDFIKGKI